MIHHASMKTKVRSENLKPPSRDMGTSNEHLRTQRGEGGDTVEEGNQGGAGVDIELLGSV
jgi:hypothetical protein